MCVAVFKPAGVKLPSQDILEASFIANPDGAGMAFPITKDDGSKVMRIVKGLQTFEEFLQKFEEFNTLYGFEALPMLMHFRIGTHGSKASPEHTHPFPVVNNYVEMCKLDTECNMAAVHNGIFRFTGGNDSSYNSTYGVWDYETKQYRKKPPEESPSDTMEFLRRLVWPVSVMEGFFQNDPVLDLILSLTQGNKLILLDAEGQSVRFGQFVEHEDIFYSNDSFRPRKKAKEKAKHEEKESSKLEKEIVEATLQAEMVKFLADSRQSLCIAYDDSIESFDEALKACGLTDFWPPDKRKTWDRLYADCLQYDPVFEPESKEDLKDPKTTPQSGVFFFDTFSKFGVKSSSQYLLYREAYLWRPKEHCFDFWGMIHYNYFATGYLEGFGKNERWKVARWKTYVNEMFPDLEDAKKDDKKETKIPISSESTGNYLGFDAYD